jgi:hypothetical protein
MNPRARALSRLPPSKCGRCEQGWFALASCASSSLGRHRFSQLFEVIRTGIQHRAGLHTKFFDSPLVIAESLAS